LLNLKLRIFMSTSLVLRTITSSLLIAGTCIGGGMLALPLASAPGGFIPSVSLMAVVWFAMTATGLCLVEIGSWMKKEDIHFVTMASTILGKWGKWLVWVVFAFISYASLAAYAGGCGGYIAKGWSTLFGGEISKAHGVLLFVLLATPFLIGPRHILGKANDTIFALMIIAYFVIISKGLPSIRMDYLLRESWKDAPLAIPLLITAFSCQMIIPGLHAFLHNHKTALRSAVILGMTIAFVVYALWQLVVFGSVPLTGEGGLSQAIALDEQATYCLEQITHSAVIPVAASFFGLFALVTSFFGIGMGLYDFLSDGLHIPKKGRGLLYLSVLVLFPSVFFAIYCERIFLTALDMSGGFGDTILNGMIPIAMLWVGSKTIAPKKLRLTLFHYAFLTVLFLLYLAAFAHETHLRIISPESAFDNRASGIEG